MLIDDVVVIPERVSSTTVKRRILVVGGLVERQVLILEAGPCGRCSLDSI